MKIAIDVDEKFTKDSGLNEIYVARKHFGGSSDLTRIFGNSQCKVEVQVAKAGSCRLNGRRVAKHTPQATW